MAARLQKRLSISLKGEITETTLRKRHADTLASICEKLLKAEQSFSILTPEQEEVRLAHELVTNLEEHVAYGLKYAIEDGTSEYGGSSVVLSNGTCLFAVVDIKYLPDYRDDPKSQALRKKKLAKVKEAAVAHARRFKSEVAGRGTLVWAAVYSNCSGLEWVSQPGMPSDLDEVELLIPAYQGQGQSGVVAGGVQGQEAGATTACAAVSASRAAGGARAATGGSGVGEGSEAAAGWVVGAVVGVAAAVGLVLLRMMVARA